MRMDCFINMFNLVESFEFFILCAMLHTGTLAKSIHMLIVETALIEAHTHIYTSDFTTRFTTLLHYFASLKPFLPHADMDFTT